LATLKEEFEMAGFIDVLVVVLQLAGVAAVVYGLFLKLQSDVAMDETPKGLASGR
jgi:hypothetical protein